MLKRILLVLVPLVVILVVVLALLLTETRELTGIVRDAETHAPIADAVVELAENRVNTNEQGRYTMAIPRSRGTLAASADGYEALQTELNGDDLFQRSFAIDFALPPNAVKATVRDAETKLPLPNVAVQFGDRSITTNAQGAVDLRGVKLNTSIALEIPGYQAIAFSFNGRLEFDLPVVPNQVAVSVLDRYTNQPVANAQLELPEGKFAGDAQGRVALKRIKPGTTIRASAAGFETAGVTFAGSDLAIALRPNTLDGVVLDLSNNQPLSGTLVYLDTTMATTNAKGAYHFDNVPAKATLVFKAAGYRKTQVEVNGTTRQDAKLAPFLARGVHIPFGVPTERAREVMDLAGKTELNAVVISVKAEKGRVEWDSQVSLAREIGAPFSQGTDLNQVIETCRAKKIYCIARLPVFQDTLLATMRPTYAIKSPNGTVFMENGGTAWVSAYNTDVWNYNIALAKEIAAMGFDEIQWDYVRFPGQANVFLGPGNSEEARIAAITGFLARAQKELRPTGVFVSADVFGLTAATDDDQFIGQRLRDLGPYVDYVSPMVYPDTWREASDLIARGLGIKNCTVAIACPYDIIYNSYKRAAEKTPTKVRLWLQAYSGSGDFGVKEYRIQKTAAVDAGSYGWLFWNGGGIYDPKIFDSP